MAKNKRSKVSFGKALEVQLLSRPFTSHGHTLSLEDQERCANALALWLLAACDIGLTNGLERYYSNANVQQCARWLTGEDIADLNDQCKSILVAVRHWQPHMGLQSYKAYKAYLDNGEVCGSIVWILKPLLDLFWRTHSWTVFRDINTLLQFWSRLTLHDLPWVEQDMLSEYVAAESQMKEWVYPEELTSPLCTIVSEWLAGWDPYGSRPRHSNGATAEVRKRSGEAAKWDAARWSRTTLSGLSALGWEHPLIPQLPVVESPGVSKLQFVPKGVDKKRSISMEPTDVQYLQQALFVSLDQWFDRHPSLGIDLHNQGKSQYLARVGSRDGSWSTIDLSAASDSVTWTLAKQLFRKTALYPYLWWARSFSVELPDGTVLELAKCAPMGSALCFPIECIVFAAIAALACDTVGIPRRFRVYGDDIVIDSRACEALIKILGDLHFKVNEEKSFGPYSFFLEACGIECYCGHDVTPFRLSRRYDVIALRASSSPSAYEGAIDVINRAYDFGLCRVRRYLIEDMPDDAPYSTDPATGIFHPCPGAPQTLLRAACGCYDYQRFDAVYRVCRAHQSAGPDDIRYITWLERASYTHRTKLSVPEDRLDVRVGPTSIRLCRRRTPYE